MMQKINPRHFAIGYMRGFAIVCGITALATFTYSIVRLNVRWAWITIFPEYAGVLAWFLKRDLERVAPVPEKES
jgi:hypothetical protein